MARRPGGLGGGAGFADQQYADSTIPGRCGRSLGLQPWVDRSATCASVRRQLQLRIDFDLDLSFFLAGFIKPQGSTTQQHSKYNDKRIGAGYLNIN